MSVNPWANGPTVSKRKPHNGNAGYVCELKSKHPKLPGHFVVYDAAEAGLCDEGGRWALVHEPSGYLINFTNQKHARAMMKSMAAGGDDGDFGQHDAEGGAQ